MERLKSHTPHKNKRKEQEKELDEALDESFPASDPAAPVQPNRKGDKVDEDELTS